MDIKTMLEHTKILLLLNESNNKTIKHQDIIIQKMLDFRESILNVYNKQAEEINAVIALIKQLPEKYQSVIIQKYFENKSIENIAKNLNCSSEDVLKIHDLALKQLADLIK